MLDVWLKRRMASHGYKAKYVADQVGVDEGTVSRWVKGDTKPERIQVIRLSRLFRVSPATILKLTDPNELAAKTAEAEQLGTEADVLITVPEVREFVTLFLRLSPSRRAAILLLMAQEGDQESQG